MVSVLSCRGESYFQAIPGLSPPLFLKQRRFCIYIIALHSFPFSALYFTFGLGFPGVPSATLSVGRRMSRTFWHHPLEPVRGRNKTMKGFPHHLSSLTRKLPERRTAPASTAGLTASGAGLLRGATASGLRGKGVDIYS